MKVSKGRLGVAMNQSKSRADVAPGAKELSAVFSFDSLKRKPSRLGFTLIELLIVVGIILTIASLAIPRFMGALYLAKVARAVGDMNALEKEVIQYQLQKGTLPLTLADIGRATLLDPWGHPYQYLNFSTAGGPGNGRTDRFGIPINPIFDLYSMGQDGASVASLTAAVSLDDVIFADNGGYFGLASDY
jgi:general secretion pathway protein G